MNLAVGVILTLTGDWQIKVGANGVMATVNVAAPDLVRVGDEKISNLPLYNPQAPEYARGVPLAGVRAEECSVRYALNPASLVVHTPSNSLPYSRGKDYEADLTWGCVGRLEGGLITADATVVVSYSYETMRLDSVILTADNKIVIRNGTPHVANPQPPALASGETRLANIWISARLPKLGEANLFPILETVYPEPAKSSPTPAEKSIPKTMAKLNAGGKVRILAWGDSVTDGSFLPEPNVNRWQEQFAKRLRARYPKAEIMLMTEAWGGRNTDSYRAEPPGSLHNYQEKVLNLRPDLIISEFVNDAGLDETGVYQRYGQIQAEFKAIGAEWIILTPHYVRPDWMGLTVEKGIDEDPRAYVKALRKFTAENHIAIAEGSLRYGRLWRQGIPHSTLMLNNINHPNAFGMKLFADALMAIFPDPPN